jgi:glycosyltransferase involved in cell wall biosynthesis
VNGLPKDMPPAEHLAARPLVVHVVHELAFGGLENGLVNLLNGPLGGQYRHAIVCLTRSTAFSERLQRPDIDIYELHKPPGPGLGIYPRLWKLLRRLRPAIVHTNNLAALESQWIAALAGVPVRLHSEHGWSAADPRGANPRHRLLRRWTDRWVTRYIPVSRDIARWLVEDIGLPRDKVELVGNGVDTDRFAPVGPTVEKAPWQRGDVVIGCVARMDPVKGPRVLVEAFAALAARQPVGAPKLWLAWIGEGPERTTLETAVAEFGLEARVWLPGARDDIPLLLRSFHVFALASLNEGISYTLLEAMSSGLPVVACAVGGNPEVVVDGVTGRLVPSGDVNRFADALADYVQNAPLRHQHGGAGREVVKNRFSMASMQVAYTAIYARLCAGKK